MLSNIHEYFFWSQLQPYINNVSLGYLGETSCCDEDTQSKGVKAINHLNLLNSPHLVEIIYLLELTHWLNVIKTERTTDIHVCSVPESENITIIYGK